MSDDFPFVAELRRRLLAAAEEELRRPTTYVPYRLARGAAVSVVAAALLLGIVLPLRELAGLLGTGGEPRSAGSTLATEQLGMELRVSTFQLEPGITDVATGFGSVWVAGPQGIARLALADGRRMATIPFQGDTHGRIVAAGDAVWATDGGSSLVRIDPAQDAIVGGIATRGHVRGLVAQGEDVWVSTSTEGGDRLILVRSRDASIVDELPIPLAGSLQLGEGSLWIFGAGTAVRLDTDTMDRTVINFPATGPAVIAGGHLWAISEGDVLDPSDSAVVRVDVKTGKIAQSIPVLRAAAIAADETHVWILSTPGSLSDELYIPDPSEPAFVTLIDPMTGEIRARAPVDITPATLEVGEGSAWLAHYETGVVTRIEAVR